MKLGIPKSYEPSPVGIWNFLWVFMIEKSYISKYLPDNFILYLGLIHCNAKNQVKNYKAKLNSLKHVKVLLSP